MSIPWRECPPQHIVQLATAAATFLAPFALVFLSKKITSIARRIRERGQTRVHRSRRKESVILNQEACNGFPEGDKVEVPKAGGATLGRDVFVEVDVNQNEDQDDLRADHDPVFQGALYCRCDSLGNNLAVNRASQDEGERGDGGTITSMEQLHSEICLREKGKLGELNEQKRSLDTLKPDKSVRGRESKPRDASKPRELVRSPQMLHLDKKMADEGYKALMDELKTSIKDHAQPVQLGRCSSDEDIDPGRPTEQAEATGGMGIFEDSQKADTAPEEFAGIPRDRPNSPRNAVLSAKNRPSSQERDKVEDENPSSSWEETEESGLEASELEENLQKTAGEAECQNKVVETCAQEDYGRLQQAGSAPLVERRSLFHDTQFTQGNPQDAHLQIEHRYGKESAAEPHEAASLSSSCESFTTANCSTTTSFLRMARDITRNSDTEPECYQTPRKENRDRRGHRHEARERYPRMCRHHKRGRNQVNVTSDSAPIFKLATPPPSFFSESRSRLRNRARDRSQDSQHSQDSQDSQCSEETVFTDESETDDSSGLHGGSQSEVEETQHFTQWLSSALKSWLPAFLETRETRQMSPRRNSPSKRRRRNDQFEEYDVRNVLERERQQNVSPGAKPCPHSCVSSLCNFRRTLESWKKQLLAMHDALDASSAALSNKSCVYCREDQPSGSHHNCYTMQIAQVFWRTVLQFKRSHLESSECPIMKQYRLGSTSDTTNKEPQTEDPIQCSLGHRHSCSSDYSGCIQQPGTPDKKEAPCVHVLLNDVDTLLRKLEGIKEDSSPGSSHSGSASGRRRKNHGDGNLDEQGRSSEDKSSGSMISPSPSISLAGELGELEEMADSVLNLCTQSSNESLRGKDSEQRLTGTSENDFIRGQGAEYEDGMAIRESTGDSTDKKRRASGESSAIIPCEIPSSELQVEEESRPPSRLDELTISKTKVLGKFALRYLEHIEKSLERSATSSPDGASPKPSCGGDVPNAHEETLQHTSDAQALQDSQLPRAASNSPHDRKLSASELSHPNDASNRQSPEDESTEARREPSLVAAFREIISDLDKLHAGKPVARRKPPPKESKNVKFSLPTCPPQSRSLTEASPRANMNSPPLQQAQGQTSSSCVSLAASGEEVSQKNAQDLSVNQAFDQLDKVVDDLLKLINVQPVDIAET